MIFNLIYYRSKMLFFTISILICIFMETSCLRPIPGYENFTPYPELVPARSIQELEDVSVLWAKELELANPHKAEVKFFLPGNDAIVFWRPQNDELSAIDVVTGSTVWETEVPDHDTMRLFKDKFYIVSYDWFEALLAAPVASDKEMPDCSWGGKASVLKIDPFSGEIIWAYTYVGVGPHNIFFNDQNLYLIGSGDHGSSFSLAQIDTRSGTLTDIDCYKWPRKKDVSIPTDDEGVFSSNLSTVIREKEDLERIFEERSAELVFFAEDNHLTIWDGKTKNVKGSIIFQGYEFNPWEIDVAVSGNVAVVYFDDSNQLFSFRLDSWGID